MESVLYGYAVNGPTWAYLSALLIVAVYFRFGRVWSSRNLDLLLLLCLSPGALLTQSPLTRGAGFIWLLVVTALLMARAFFDPWQKWRPRFDQNMNEAGMLFLGVCSLLFLGTRVASQPLPDATTQTIQRADALIDRKILAEKDFAPPPPTAGREEAAAGEPPADDLDAGPGAAVMAAFISYVFNEVTPRALPTVAHLAVVIGLLWAGKSTFGAAKSGVAMATLYTLLPVTAFEVGATNHLLPAALTLWAFLLHRKPVAAGVLLGLAGATQVFPLFLVPLWASYYGRAGLGRFLIGFAATLAASAGSLVFVSADVQSFLRLVLGSFYPYIEMLSSEQSDGVWGGGAAWAMYRPPVVLVYFILVAAFTAAPRPKTSEMLLAQSVVLILATQFWVPAGGGLFIQWYLPLLLLMMFRPRLTDPFVMEEPTATVRGTTPAPPTRGGTVAAGKLR